jgi:hypothetical protein
VREVSGLAVIGIPLARLHASAFQKQKLIIPTRAENAKSWVSHTGIDQSSKWPLETTMPGGDLWNSDGNRIAILELRRGLQVCQARQRRLMPPTTVYDGGPYAYRDGRDTTDVAAIVTARIGKEEVWSSPGFFFAGSNEQIDDNQHGQCCDADIHHTVYASVLRRVPFG